MKNRFYFSGAIAAGQRVELDHDETHHARVLRVHDGEAVEVFDGRGGAFAGTFDPPNAITVGEPIESRESDTPVCLAMAIIQLEKFELVLQKATELGVASVIPLVTERCEVRPERYRGKGERWQKILFEATKQSGRSRIPQLESPAPFEDIVKRPGRKIVFDADNPVSAGGEAGPVTLFIGPEGGWSERELEMARANGCRFEQLGPRRLRAETAAIVASAFATLHH